MPDSFDFSARNKQDNDLFSQIPTITTLVCIACFIVTFAYYTAGGYPGENIWTRMAHSVGVETPTIWNGHYEGLFTNTFLHANPLGGLGFTHLLFNMFWLWRLGSILELTMHPVAYVIFLLSSMFVSSSSEMLISETSGIGMSGVVYAMFGMMWMGRGNHPSWRSIATLDNLRFFVIWAVFCVIATQTGVMRVANGAHFGGLIYGLAVGAVFCAPRKRYIWTIPLVILFTLDILSLTWMPWSPRWTFWKGTKSLEQHHYAQAIKWYETAMKRGGSKFECYDGISRAWAQIALEARQKGDNETADKASIEANKASEYADQYN